MKKRMKGFCTLLSAALAAGILLCGTGASPARLPRNCFVDGTDVSRLTRAQALELLSERCEEEFAGAKLCIAAGGREYVFAAPELYVRTDAKEVLRGIVRGGKYPLEKRLCLRGEESAIARVCEDAYRPCVNARVLADADGVRVLPSSQGVRVDAVRLRADVGAALSAGGGRIEACLLSTLPCVSTEQAQRSAACVARFTTRFSTGNAPRSGNIARACELIGCRTLAPGEVFSFNGTVGRRTRENGFAEAPVILDGEFVPGVGGGVCQVSTTLYNAALLAGFDVLECHPHSLAVGYVEPSFDAMVSGESDLRFQNTLGCTAYVRMVAGAGFVTAEVYAEESDRSVTRQSVVTGRIAPPEPEVREGEEDCEIRAAKEGLSSEGWLIVREGGKERRVRLRKDRYAAVRGVVQKRKEEQKDGETERGTAGEKQPATCARGTERAGARINLFGNLRHILDKSGKKCYNGENKMAQ